jgi:hypothetical protein
LHLDLKDIATVVALICGLKMSDQSKAAKKLAGLFIDDDPWASKKAEIENLKALLRECQDEINIGDGNDELYEKIEEALK